MNGAQLPSGDPELVAVVREMVQGIDGSTTASRSDDLWATLVDAEMHLLGLPVDRGGPGGEVADLVATTFECARAGVAVPLVENHLAQFLRAEAGLTVRPTVSLRGDVVAERAGGSVLSALAWTALAEEILVLDDSSAGSTARLVTSWQVVEESTGVDLAGHVTRQLLVPRDSLEAADRIAVDCAGLQARADLLRAAQLSGAIRGCFDLSRRYAGQREQFGVRIDSFPAVQHHLVQLAQASAMSRVAVLRAAAAAEAPHGHEETARLARLVCDRFAREAIRCAHQVHGAIGMTREYALAGLTRSLHWWRLVDRAPAVAGRARGRFVDNMWLETRREVS